jgi:hypothetical protein
MEDVALKSALTSFLVPIILGLTIWPLGALATPPAVPLRLTDAQCRADVARAIAKAHADAAGGVPAACWRVGPLSLGLPAVAVDRVLGPADETNTLAPDGLGPGRTYESRIYAFPRDWRAEMVRHPSGEPRLRFLEVLISEGRVVAISNDPSGRIQGGAPCHGSAPHADPPARIDPADFRPFETVLGVSLGAPAASLAEWFGTPPAHDRPGDWLNYLPVPLTFDRDDDNGRITGFAIGLDEDAVTRGAGYHMTLSRDPATCAIRSINLGV